MTNNINGIDVSECKLYDYGICDSEQVENLNCEQNPDCFTNIKACKMKACVLELVKRYGKPESEEE